jgi:XTP/dITP diphosphohydrolase
MSLHTAAIVIATGNPHKVEELSAMLHVPGISFVGLKDQPGYPFDEPHETGTTFEQNAKIKALAYATVTGQWCLADDSGLEVDALGGKPGVISSHYATDGREEGHDRATRDAMNNERLLRELTGVEPERRTARFVCVMALARPGELLASSRGTFEGRIGLPGQVPRGSNGFGYDPLFLVGPNHDRTGSELLPAQKNAVSHRARSAQRMQQMIAMLSAR